MTDASSRSANLNCAALANTKRFLDSGSLRLSLCNSDEPDEISVRPETRGRDSDGIRGRRLNARIEFLDEALALSRDPSDAFCPAGNTNGRSFSDATTLAQSATLRPQLWKRVRTMNDPRQYAPATLRNRDFILGVLRDVLPTKGVILEIASGSGEHVVHFARNFPNLVFQPSDREPERVAECRGMVEGHRRYKRARASGPGRFAVTLADRYG